MESNRLCQLRISLRQILRQGATLGTAIHVLRRPPRPYLRRRLRLHAPSILHHGKTAEILRGDLTNCTETLRAYFNASTTLNFISSFRKLYTSVNSPARCGPTKPSGPGAKEWNTCEIVSPGS